MLFDLASASVSIISSHMITELSIILSKYFPFLLLHVAEIIFVKPNIISFTYIVYTYTNNFRFFHHWYELLFLPSNLHLNLHNRCFVNVSNLFVPAMMLKLLRFISSVILGTHSLLNKSFKVLWLPTSLI